MAASFAPVSAEFSADFVRECYCLGVVGCWSGCGLLVEVGGGGGGGGRGGVGHGGGGYHIK